MDRSDLQDRAEAWRQGDPDPATAAELAALLREGNDKELSDRFSATLEFGTAGLRGVLGAGPNRMNRAVVRRTTLGLARYLLEQVPQVRTSGVVVGRDGRRMSDEFARDTAQVLAAAGIPALYFDEVVPTPVCAFAVSRLRAAAGVMVTASHNPPEYNGYKVYWGNGAQIIPPHDQGIARAIDAVGPANSVPLLDWEKARAQGLVRSVEHSLGEAYLEGILALRLHPRPSSPLRIVYTAMHGVGGRWMLEGLRRAGFGSVEPVREQQEPDGRFPTVRFPNPEEPGAMDLSHALAEKHRAELILANDPDADRLAVQARDAAGKLQALTGNEVGVLLGHYLLTQGPRSERSLVMTTIVSSGQLKHIAQQLGARYDETLTGFKWIANRAMAHAQEEQSDFRFGYEEALGYTVGTLVRDKDGIGAGLVFADLADWCRRRNTTVLGYLEEMQRQFGLFVAAQKSVTLPGAQGAQLIRSIMAAFRARPPERIGGLAVQAVRDYQQPRSPAMPASNVLAYELDSGARVTLRPSGTEPKIKYYFELKESPAAQEPMDEARLRAHGRLDALIADFLGLAQERGQPR